MCPMKRLEIDLYFEIKRLGLLALLSSVIIRCSSSSKLYRILGRADDHAMQWTHYGWSAIVFRVCQDVGAADIYHIIDIRFSIFFHVFLSTLYSEDDISDTEAKPNTSVSSQSR